MNKDKVSLQEIVDLLASRASISKRAAEEFLKTLFATIEEVLLAGEVLKIKNLGTFKLQWNEPRKSVNIQTGEEIMLDGYNKVSFTPDPLLKELVNEPFAHLKPVQLDDNDVENGNQYVVENENEMIPNEQTDVPLDTLSNFTEQASEIKNLISEINALSSRPVEAVDVVDVLPQKDVQSRETELPNEEKKSRNPEVKSLDVKVKEELSEIIRKELKEELKEEIREEIKKSIEQEFRLKKEIEEEQKEELRLKKEEDLKVEQEKLKEELRQKKEEELRIEEETRIKKVKEIEEEQLEEEFRLKREKEFEFRDELRQKTVIEDALKEELRLKNEKELKLQEELRQKKELEEKLIKELRLKREDEFKHRNTVSDEEHKKDEKLNREIKTGVQEQEEIDQKIKYYYGEQSASGKPIQSKTIKEPVKEYIPHYIKRDGAKSSKKWIWISSVLLFFAGCCFGLYFLCPTVSNIVNNWFIPTTKQIAETVVIPIDTTSVDTTNVKKPVDSLQILFDSPRVFTKFIASERLHSGSRLTKMAKRYYGTSDFWVYIYEANKDRFSDPDKIPAHSLIRIPKVDPRLIDASNPRCIKKARELHDLYVK